MAEHETQDQTIQTDSGDSQPQQGGDSSVDDNKVKSIQDRLDHAKEQLNQLDSNDQQQANELQTTIDEIQRVLEDYKAGAISDAQMENILLTITDGSGDPGALEQESIQVGAEGQGGDSEGAFSIGSLLQTNALQPGVFAGAYSAPGSNAVDATYEASTPVEEKWDSGAAETTSVADDFFETSNNELNLIDGALASLHMGILGVGISSIGVHDTSVLMFDIMFGVYGQGPSHGSGFEYYFVAPSLINYTPASSGPAPAEFDFNGDGIPQIKDIIDWHRGAKITAWGKEASETLPAIGQQLELIAGGDKIITKGEWWTYVQEVAAPFFWWHALGTAYRGTNILSDIFNKGEPALYDSSDSTWSANSIISDGKGYYQAAGINADSNVYYYARESLVNDMNAIGNSEQPLTGYTVSTYAQLLAAYRSIISAADTDGNGLLSFSEIAQLKSSYLGVGMAVEQYIRTKTSNINVINKLLDMDVAVDKVEIARGGSGVLDASDLNDLIPSVARSLTDHWQLMKIMQLVNDSGIGDPSTIDAMVTLLQDNGLLTGLPRAGSTYTRNDIDSAPQSISEKNGIVLSLLGASNGSAYQEENRSAPDQWNALEAMLGPVVASGRGSLGFKDLMPKESGGASVIAVAQMPEISNNADYQALFTKNNDANVNFSEVTAFLTSMKEVLGILGNGVIDIIEGVHADPAAYRDNVFMGTGAFGDKSDPNQLIARVANDLNTAFGVSNALSVRIAESILTDIYNTHQANLTSPTVHVNFDHEKIYARYHTFEIFEKLFENSALITESTDIDLKDFFEFDIAAETAKTETLNMLGKSVLEFNEIAKNNTVGVSVAHLQNLFTEAYLGNQASFAAAMEDKFISFNQLSAVVGTYGEGTLSQIPETNFGGRIQGADISDADFNAASAKLAANEAAGYIIAAIPIIVPTINDQLGTAYTSVNVNSTEVLAYLDGSGGGQYEVSPATSHTYTTASGPVTGSDLEKAYASQVIVSVEAQKNGPNINQVKNNTGFTVTDGQLVVSPNATDFNYAVVSKLKEIADTNGILSADNTLKITGESSIAPTDVGNQSNKAKAFAEELAKIMESAIAAGDAKYVNLDANAQKLSLDNNTEVSASDTISSVAPIIFDLGGDGIEYGSYGNTWVGPNDAMLVYDDLDDGVIRYRHEVAFTEYLSSAVTDLQGLHAFDTSKDNIIDADDRLWKSFKLWVDVNQDGSSSAGELSSLSSNNVESISLVSDNNSVSPAPGVYEHGRGHYYMEDGSHGEFADVSFAYLLDGMPLIEKEGITADGNMPLHATDIFADSSIDEALDVLESGYGVSANDTFAAGKEAVKIDDTDDQGSPSEASYDSGVSIDQVLFERHEDVV